MTHTSNRLARVNFSSAGHQDQPSGATTSRLFVYGTLVLDQVIDTLIDRIPAHKNATATGWRVVELPDEPYPGLVTDASSIATGRLYTDLKQAEWRTLDAFEDPTYSLTELIVDDGSTAWAYVWPTEHLDTTWSPLVLSEENLQNYLTRCKNWRARYEAK